MKNLLELEFVSHYTKLINRIVNDEFNLKDQQESLLKKILLTILEQFIVYDHKSTDDIAEMADIDLRDVVYAL
jgi:hypothetical protein